MSRLRSGAATCTCGWSSWMVPATPAGCRCFPDAERMVAAGHRADERRRRYIVAHAALRQELQACVHISAADLVFATSRFGKPRAVLPRVAADPLQPVAWRTPMPDRHRARWGRRSRHRADRSPRRHQFHGDRGAQ
jgi:hypothetical protein